MEAKLAEYRSKKLKERGNDSLLHGFTNFGIFKRINADQVNNSSQPPVDQKQEPISKNDANTPDDGKAAPSSVEYRSVTILWIQRGLKLLMWLLLWLYFISLQFGAVYFVTSILVIVYFSTGTGPKKDKKLSAYSVFNPNFERLDGTFTAEQFEKELKFGAASVH